MQKFDNVFELMVEAFKTKRQVERLMRGCWQPVHPDAPGVDVYQLQQDFVGGNIRLLPKTKRVEGWVVVVTDPVYGGTTLPYRTPLYTVSTTPEAAARLGKASGLPHSVAKITFEVEE